MISCQNQILLAGLPDTIKFTLPRVLAEAAALFPELSCSVKRDGLSNHSASSLGLLDE